ncbi:MAG: SEC-C metal-binding domain-containing protein [Trueperaceae bacterium]|nr:SEC-C metal-binding domain-containing protein [Trueperaceae bacterium]
MKTPGRNEPCPCGSGKKYKHCCLHRPGGIPRVPDDVPPPGAQQADWDDTGEAGAAASFFDQLRDAMKDHEFTSLAEAQDFAQSFTTRHNQDPAPGFDGLSPEQMQALLYAPTTSPEVLHVAETLTTPPRAPLLAWFHLIADALGQNGVPATQKGNLPLKLCRDALRAAQGDPDYGPAPFELDPDRIRSEEDTFLLHDTRVVARVAGLLRLHRKRWTLTRRARQALAAGDDAALYLRLFDALTSRVDWRYHTRYHELDMLQRTWPFLIRLLQRYGDARRPAAFYVGALLEAFPGFEDETIAGIDPWTLQFEDPVETALERMRSTVTFLALERFARPLGLVTLEPDGRDPIRPWRSNWIVQATPLAREVVRFEV